MHRKQGYKVDVVYYNRHRLWVIYPVLLSFTIIDVRDYIQCDSESFYCWTGIFCSVGIRTWMPTGVSRNLLTGLATLWAGSPTLVKLITVCLHADDLNVRAKSQDRQCTYDVIFRRVCESLLLWKSNKY